MLLPLTQYNAKWAVVTGASSGEPLLPALPVCELSLGANDHRECVKAKVDELTGAYLEVTGAYLEGGLHISIIEEAADPPPTLCRHREVAHAEAGLAGHQRGAGGAAGTRSRVE